MTMSAAKAVKATFSIPTCSGLGCAVDSTLTWGTYKYYAGDSYFYSQSTYRSGLSGTSAARSGKTSNYGYTCVYTYVQAPGTLTYIWSPSSENGYDWLVFYYNDVWYSAISGSGAESGKWYQDTWAITGSGSYPIDFCYEKDYGYYSYLDAGFVDKVTYTRSSSAALSENQSGPPKISLLSSMAINAQGLAISGAVDKVTIRRAGEVLSNLRSPRVRIGR